MKALFTLLASLSLAAAAQGDNHEHYKTVVYEHDGVTFESTIVFQEDPDEIRPGILMVPNWMGPTEASLEKAIKIADDDYIVMMVDMYGIDTRPENAQEAGQAAGKIRGDREMMRARALEALKVFRREAAPHGLDVDNVAAIGFCFGGGTVLELGRAGADVDAIVSFHGDLVSPTLEEDAAETQAKVLVLHGADDPYVPQDDVQAFVAAMQGTDVDWQLVQFSGTVHSFTDPNANSDGAKYHPRSAERSFEYMEELFEEIWSDDD